MPHRIASVLTIGLLLLASCGGSSSSGTPATAAILFPTSMSTSELSLVTVRGTAENAAAVRVNGVAAVSGDGFATWQAVVPLDHGANTLQVDARNPSGVWATSAATATIHGRRHAFAYLGAIAFDPTSQLLWVVDRDREAVIEINLTTEERRLLSGDGVPDAVNEFNSIRDIAYDATRNRLLVQEGDALFIVDPTTGARSVLASAAVPDSTNHWDDARHLVVDTVNDRYLVANRGSSTPLGIFAVDPTSGARTILSNNATPDAVNPFSDILSMALDGAGNRVFIGSATDDQVVAVDLTTGARTLFSSPSVPDATNTFSSPDSLALDAAGSRLLLFQDDSGDRKLLGIDLTTGARTVISEEGDGKGHRLTAAEGLVVDPTGNRALVVLDDSSEILAVDLTSGNRTEIASIHTPEDPTEPFFPVGIDRDPETGALYATDYDIGALIRIDPDTGERTMVSGPGVPNDDNPISDPYDVALDLDRNRALVCSTGGPERIIAVDLTTGERTVFASETVSGRGGNSWYSIVIDAPRNRALVGDAGLQSVLAMDLDSGAITTFTDATTPDAVDPLDYPSALLVDLPRNRLLVGDNNDSIYEVNLTTGARSLLVDNELGEPWGRMVYDETTDTLFIADYDYYGVIAVDLTTQTVDNEWGTYEGLYYANTPWEPYGIAHDADRGLFYVTDYTSGGIVVIDTVTRERVFLTR